MKMIDIANQIAEDNKDFVHAWVKDDEKTVAQKIVSAIGFWPEEAKSVKFYHGDKRVMKLCRDRNNNEYWTCVLTREEYHAICAGLPLPKDFKDELNLARLNISSALGRLNRLEAKGE